MGGEGQLLPVRGDRRRRRHHPEIPGPQRPHRGHPRALPVAGRGPGFPPVCRPGMGHQGRRESPEAAGALPELLDQLRRPRGGRTPLRYLPRQPRPDPALHARQPLSGPGRAGDCLSPDQSGCAVHLLRYRAGPGRRRTRRRFRAGMHVRGPVGALRDHGSPCFR